MKLPVITLFLTFLSLTSSLTVLPMDPPGMIKAAKWARKAVRMLTGEIPTGNIQEQLNNIPNDSFPFGQLPKELQKDIVFWLSLYGSATSLEEACQTISLLAQTNKFLNELINDHNFCLHIIKNLSYKFNTSDITVCKSLTGPMARYILQQQNDLFNVCSYSILSTEEITEKFNMLLKNGANINFTYEPNQKTLLMIAAASNSTAVKLLLDAGIDPEITNTMGFTALRAAEGFGNGIAITLIKDAIAKKHQQK